MSCYINKDNKSTPSNWAFRYAWDNFIPLTVTLELTLRCNLKCTHCYNLDRTKPQPSSLFKAALDLDTLKQSLIDMKELGTLMVSFTGGESLVHPHLEELTEFATELGLYVKLKSNGVLLTEKKVQRVVELGAKEVDISLYGASPAVHDGLTQINGSFEKTILGAKAAKKGGLIPTLNIILTRGNYTEFSQMVDLADSLGISFNVSTEITKRYDGTDDTVINHQLRPEDLRKLYTGEKGDYFLGQTNDSENISCGCARLNCGIGANGNVYPCIGAPVLAGNLKENRLKDIWHNSAVFKKIRGLETKDFKDCNSCPTRPYCQRSSGAVYMNTGDYTGKEQWACDQAELLKELS